MRRLAILGSLLAVVACAGGGERQASAPTGGWLTDAATGCKVWTAAPATYVAVTWSGACRDGFASGMGVAVLTGVAGERPGSTPKVVFQGSLEGGKREGLGFTEASTGDVTIAQYKSHVRTGQVYSTDLRGKGGWVVGDADAQGAVKKWESIQTDAPGVSFRQWLGGRTQTHAEYAALTRLFDFPRYPSLEAAKRAIEEAFPIGRKSPDLIQFLDIAMFSNSGDVLQIYYGTDEERYCKREANLATYPNVSRFCVLARRLPTSSGTVDRFVYLAVLDGEASLVASQTFLFFDKGRFSDRGVPLRPENFSSSGRFIEAVLELLGPTPTVAEVGALMGQAGMEDVVPQQSEEPGVLVHIYDAPRTASLITAIMGCDVSIGVEFRFGADTKRLLEAKPSLKGCV